MAQDGHLQIDAALDGLALASALKRLSPDHTWSQVKRLIATRHVNVNGALITDPARPVHQGDWIELLARSRPMPPSEQDVGIRHLDEHLVVVEKPPRIVAVRRAEELGWSDAQKAERPALDEMLTRMLRARPGMPPDLVVRGVHRLDRDTSGLMVFALSDEAQEPLAALFQAHAIERHYLAIVHGHPRAQRIESWLVRDRGDGLRGSSPRGALTPHAHRSITHIDPVESVGPYSVIRCRLETGRTHQIRIHLFELGHMLCGERTYTHRPGEPPQRETNRAPRQALHSTEVRFLHPVTRQELHFVSPLAPDLAKWLDRARRGCGKS